jgi:hypothetical protein
MKDWHRGWLNTFMYCPNGCGVLRTYLGSAFPLKGQCFDCASEMEGFRIIEKELA